MLQSSNQYLRPDYLAAPTALDTKSSPLALLAQTCSAIGADTTNPKLLAANIEKSTKSLKSSGGTGDSGGRDKSSPVSSHSSSVSTGSVEQQQIKSSFKPYEPNNNINSSSNSNSLGMSLHLDGGGSGGGSGGDMERATNLTTSSASSQQPSSNHRVRTPKSSNGQTAQSQNGQLTPSALHHGAGGSSGAAQRCDSNQSATSQRDSPAMGNGLRRTPSATSMAMDLQQRSNASPHQQQRSMTSKESAGGGAGGSPHTQASPQAAASAASRLQAASDAAYAAAAKENYVKALHAAAAAAASGMPQQQQQPSAVPTSSAGPMGGSYYPGYPSTAGGGGGMPYPMDLMTASALMSPHHPMFKSALHPYLNYARLKSMDAAAAAAMMVPNICRDPYCTGCPSSPHYLNKAAGQPCPAGCPQCESGGGSAGGPPGSKAPSGGSGAASSAAAAAAASYHAQLAALAAASQMPYVCSWIGGDTAYCGKRFGTSDELFQHLRTHTASMPDSVLSAAAAGGIPPNHPLFQRTYPTPPLSPLSAARYHPYGKPSMLPPTLGPPGSLAGMPMPPHPALAQYFSPYALYGGPRMGSSHP